MLYISNQVYEQRFPEAVTYPVFRVDIVRRQDGRFVVNEFESLEAQIHCSVVRSNIDSEVDRVMEEFWLDELYHLAKLPLNV